MAIPWYTEEWAVTQTLFEFRIPYRACSTAEYLSDLSNELKIIRQRPLETESVPRHFVTMNNNAVFNASEPRTGSWAEARQLPTSGIPDGSSLLPPRVVAPIHFGEGKGVPTTTARLYSSGNGTRDEKLAESVAEGPDQSTSTAELGAFSTSLLGQSNNGALPLWEKYRLLRFFRDADSTNSGIVDGAIASRCLLSLLDRGYTIECLSESSADCYAQQVEQQANAAVLSLLRAVVGPTSALPETTASSSASTPASNVSNGIPSTASENQLGDSGAEIALSIATSDVYLNTVTVDYAAIVDSILGSTGLYQPTRLPPPSLLIPDDASAAPASGKSGSVAAPLSTKRAASGTANAAAKAKPQPLDKKNASKAGADAIAESTVVAAAPPMPKEPVRVPKLRFRQLSVVETRARAEQCFTLANSLARSDATREATRMGAVATSLWSLAAERELQAASPGVDAPDGATRNDVYEVRRPVRRQSSSGTEQLQAALSPTQGRYASSTIRHLGCPSCRQRSRSIGVGDGTTDKLELTAGASATSTTMSFESVKFSTMQASGAEAASTAVPE